MKLHRLELQGIGPFASKYTVDFDRLSVSGIYLLDGPTGSGKSTIIDAITWALYGGVAGGNDSTPDRIRSTHADPKLESYVDLVFSVNAGTYRVRRTPSWTKEGNKNPTNVTAKLWKLYDGALESEDLDAGAPLETKAQGVGSEVTRIIGLNRDQFVQTIVLPQGKFAEFLRLNSTERTGLLEQIFGTEIYRRVAEKLAAMAGAANKKVEEAKRAFLTSFDYLVEASNAEEAKVEGFRTIVAQMIDPGANGEVLEAIEVLRSEAEAEVAAAAMVRDSAEAQLVVAQKKLAAEETLAVHVATRSSLLQRQAQLNGERHEISAFEESLRTNLSAKQVLPQVEALEKADRAARDTHRALRKVSRMAPDAVDESLVANAEEDIARLSSLTGTLAELEKVEHAVVKLRREQVADKASLSEKQEALARAVEAAATLPSQLENARVKQQAAAQTYAGLASAKTTLNEALARSKRVAELGELRTKIGAAEKQVATRITAFVAAKAEHDRLTAAWISSTAANLALELKDEIPCPVCGSRQHPSPAVKAEVFATHEEVEAAEAIRTKCETAVRESEKSLEALRATSRIIESDLGGLTSKDAHQQVTSAKAAVTAAETAGREATKQAKSVASLEGTYEETTQQVATHRKEIAVLESRISVRTDRIAQDEGRLTEELDGFESISKRITAHRTTVASKNAELAAMRSLLAARISHNERSEELDEALTTSPFSSALAVRNAVVDRKQASLWEERISKHKQDLHDVERDLAAPEIAGLSGNEQPHVDEARSAQRAAQQRAETARTATTTAEITARQVAQREQQLRTNLDVWGNARATAGPIIRLAGLANGTSEYSFTKMTLPTYVLNQRFKLVVERANEHLAVFSLGRYELVSTEEKEKGSRAQRVGLGLEIIDHVGDANGDVRRATKSLSGGETFYVSLSLALALADVVCSENGGIQLDTLMIDEGFGTLDENTRDQVMQVLTSLASNGRAVAVVSHVEELKKMIAEQIVVRPLPDGSSTLEVRA